MTNENASISLTAMEVKVLLAAVANLETRFLDNGLSRFSDYTSTLHDKLVEAEELFRQTHSEQCEMSSNVFSD